MYGYIYKTTNLINNKIYVGQHRATSFDSYYKGSGTLLYKALKKYGVDNFKTELVEWCESEDELNKKEIYYIDKLKSKVTYGNYNMSDGGPVPRLSGELNGNFGKHRPHTPEEKQHLSNVLKGHAPTFTRSHTAESKEKMAAATRNYNKYKKDYKQLSEHNKGSKILTNGTESHWFYGDDVAKYIELGWKIGNCNTRKPYKWTKKRKQADLTNGVKLKDTVWIHCGDVKHQVHKQELDEWFSKGYTLGMK